MIKFVKNIIDKIFNNSQDFNEYYFYDIKMKMKILLPIKEKLIYETRSGIRYALVSHYKGRKYHVFVKQSDYDLAQIK